MGAYALATVGPPHATAVGHVTAVQGERAPQLHLLLPQVRWVVIHHPRWVALGGRGRGRAAVDDGHRVWTSARGDCLTHTGNGRRDCSAQLAPAAASRRECPRRRGFLALATKNSTAQPTGPPRTGWQRAWLQRGARAERAFLLANPPPSPPSPPSSPPLPLVTAGAHGDFHARGVGAPPTGRSHRVCDRRNIWPSSGAPLPSPLSAPPSWSVSSPLPRSPLLMSPVGWGG